MQNTGFLPLKKLVLFVGVTLIFAQASRAQSVYVPYSYQFDQKFNSTIYSTKTAIHTSLKPFLADSLIAPRYNQLLNVGVDTNRKSWVPKKLFNEHLISIKDKDYTFYADFMTDIQGGRDVTNKINTFLNTRGYQVGGTIGNKFSFYTSGFENSAIFPQYLTDYINKIGFVTGQAYDRDFGAQKKDWSYVTALLSYSPTKQINIAVGEDKTFIGDGYRSLLLSDFAASYPLLRVTANVGPLQYMVMWTNMEDINAPKFDSFGNNRRKWAAFHYLDWNVSNRFSLGFFNAVIAQGADNSGNPHGFDANLINPVFFARSIGPSAQPDNVLAGFTGKYKIFDKTAIYAQVLLDRFKASDLFSTNNTDNTNGLQVGIRGADLFKVHSFNYLFEFNTVKPFTYSSQNLLTNYTDYSEPLGDPLGANFQEFIGILNYTIGRFDFMGQVNYAQYGLDPFGTNFGKDVTKTYSLPSAATTVVGQGIATNLYYAEGKVSYLINPKLNLRFELGGLVRDESNSLGSKKTTVITFGLRSTFRNLYHDF